MTMSIDTLNFLRGITTILAMSAFVAVFLWAWSRRRRDSFEAAAQLPLEEDADIVDAGRQTPPQR